MRIYVAQYGEGDEVGDKHVPREVFLRQPASLIAV
jgi:hypothetical protein